MIRVLPWVVLVLISSGCVSSPKAPHRRANSVQKSSSVIEEINVLAVPVALNFDNIPGPDGFVITIYGGNHTLPKAVPLEIGTLEILMFDGLLPGNAIKSPTPLKTWDFTASDLKRYAGTTSIGTGYQIPNLWGDAAPRAGKITVIVRYTSPSGAILYSAPGIIAVPAN